MRAFNRGRALAAREQLGPSGDLAPLLSRLGLELIPWRFDGRVREVIFERAIGVDQDLPHSWQRWLTAHAVGHHLLHTGTSFYLASWQWVDHVKAERQAEEFAAGLLVPRSALANPGEAALARRCAIPREKARWVLSHFDEAAP